MKKFTKSIIFSTTLVMAATSQAQQMEEHEHKGSDKPEIQTGMPMRGQDMHMMNAKIKSMKEEVNAIKEEKQNQVDMAERHLKMMEVMMSKMDGSHSPESQKHSN